MVPATITYHHVPSLTFTPTHSPTHPLTLTQEETERVGKSSKGTEITQTLHYPKSIPYATVSLLDSQGYVSQSMCLIHAY